MSFIGDFQVRFPCRGAAFDLSPALKRRERRHLDLRVAERRLSEGSQEQSEQEPWPHGEIVRRLCRSTVAPRLWGIIMRIPAFKRRTRLKCRSAAGRSSFQKLVKIDRTIRKCVAVLIFTILAGKISGSGEAIAATRQVEELTVVTTAAPVCPPIPEETCPLHGERMRLGLAEIRYGLPNAEIVFPNDLAHIWQNIRHKIRRRFSYDEAERKYFPESRLWVGGGCMVEVEKKAETLYCQSCRNAELKWRKRSVLARGLALLR